MDKIKILVVDDAEETRKHIVKLLSLEDEFQISGEAGDGIEAVNMAQGSMPDIILMDINMPKMDGIAATEVITIKCPNISIIIMSVQEEQEYLRKAMIAGARDFLVKPFETDDLISTIKKVYERGKQRAQVMAPESQNQMKKGIVTSFFSTKGGVGKTTIAINTAVALKKLTKKNVVILDFDLQFGDVGIMMRLKSPNTVSELCQELPPYSSDKIEPYLVRHEESEIDVLLACSSPQLAEIISSDMIREIIENMQYMYDYVIIDTTAIFRDIELTIMDLSQFIIVIGTLEISAIKNMKICLNVLKELEYDAGKVKVIMNRAIPAIGIDPEHVQKSLKWDIDVLIPSDGKLAVNSLNEGLPFYLKDSKAPLSKAMVEIAKLIAVTEGGFEEIKDQSILGKISSLFGG